jgi:hypothetical protein
MINSLISLITREGTKRVEEERAGGIKQTGKGIKRGLTVSFFIYNDKKEKQRAKAFRLYAAWE